MTRAKGRGTSAACGPRSRPPSMGRDSCFFALLDFWVGRLRGETSEERKKKKFALVKANNRKKSRTRDVLRRGGGRLEKKGKIHQTIVHRNDFASSPTLPEPGNHSPACPSERHASSVPAPFLTLRPSQLGPSCVLWGGWRPPRSTFQRAGRRFLRSSGGCDDTSAP